MFLRATAAWLRAARRCSGGGRAMALTRPPGHHAKRAVPNGFCVYNFAGAAATRAAEDDGLRVAVLDWDVHYGQGVADVVGGKASSIRYASLHQTPAFPYEGEERAVTSGGNVMTVPIEAGTTWETGYRDAFVDAALPFLFGDNDYNNEWSNGPDLVIVCAGYDALGSDELASVELDPADFGRMTDLVRERISAKAGADGERVGLLIGLEGGYQLKDEEKGLSAAVVETVKALCRD